jgi:hypothetical protein
MADSNSSQYAAARDQLSQLATRLQQMADSAVPPPELNNLMALNPSAFNTAATNGSMGPFNMQVGAPTSLRPTLAQVGSNSQTFIKGMVGSMDWGQQLINRSMDQLERIEQEYSAAFKKAGTDIGKQQQATQAMQRQLGAIANQIPRSARALAGPQ